MENGLYKHSFKTGEKPITSLSVYNTGMQRCESGYSWGPGIRDHYLVHYVMSGQGTYTLGGKVHALVEGDMFLVWPNTMVTYQADIADPWSYCWVGFGGLDAETLIRQTGFSGASPTLHIAQGGQARTLLLDIYESRGVKPHEMTRMTGKLYAFLSWLMEAAQAGGGAHAKRQASQIHVQRACEFIINNYSSPISIQDIARNVGVCRSLLNRAFQQHMDMSPVQYLTRYRMTQACILLKRTDLPIKAVAYSVGYEDPLYFSRRFREMEGISPREYADRQEEALHEA